MIHPSLEALAPAALPPPAVPLGQLQLVLLLAASLVATTFFAVLRSALLHSGPARILERVRSEAHGRRLTPLLQRVEALATSASVFEITFQVLFLIALLALIDTPGWTGVGLAILCSVPILVFASQVFPTILSGNRTDALLRRVLPAFDIAQKPLAALVYGLEALRRAIMRLLRIPERPHAVRWIVEDLRGVIEGKLDETGRELIENVVEFHDVDVAEVMTPRTELSAVEVGDGLPAIVRLIAETGHTRIPVYEGDLDKIIGLAYAQDVIGLVSNGEYEGCDLRGILRPVNFVPETKRVAGLLTEFRRDKQKTAVVIDEYGGTAGLVSMGDLVAEIVGDIRQEFGEEAPAAIRRLEDGTVEVLASTRVSEVNEELGLDLPEEEDYETLAGFVLAEFGRFPRRAETLVRKNVEYFVVEASDRRVLVVRIRRLEPQVLS